MKLPTHILIGTDFSPASEPAVLAGASLAKALGARVTLVHVFDVTDAIPPMAIPKPERMEKAIEKEMEGKVLELLNDLRKDKLGDVENVDVVAVSHPNAAHGICTTADERDADLIVVSTHGRTGLRHLLIGSVAERVVRHARRPVLTVHPGGE